MPSIRSRFADFHVNFASPVHISLILYFHFLLVLLITDIKALKRPSPGYDLRIWVPLYAWRLEESKKSVWFDRLLLLIPYFSCLLSHFFLLPSFSLNTYRVA